MQKLINWFMHEPTYLAMGRYAPFKQLHLAKS